MNFMAFLFNTRSYSATFWSCWITDPVCCVVRRAKAAWFAWIWPSLLAWAFIFSTAFFQFVNGLVVYTSPVCSRDVHPYVLHILQNTPSQSTSYSSQVKSFSHLFWYFLLLLVLVVWYFDCFFECSLSGILIQDFLLGGMSLSSSLLLSLLLRATDVDGVLELKKYDLISILNPGKSWLNLTSRFYYYETI